jgi:hypothetical protein
VILLFCSSLTGHSFLKINIFNLWS